MVANSLTNFLDLIVQRGKQDNKNSADLIAKGLLNLQNFRNQTNVIHFEMFKNLDTFTTAAQMIKIFAPYFFKPNLSKEGERRQFSPFQMLAVLQLLEATRIYEPEMFQIYAKQVDD